MVLPYISMNPPQVYTCSPSWTLLPLPSPYHRSESSQCTSPKHPVSYIEPGLATRFIYDIIHVSMPFSQIIPPSPSPTESKRLFYTLNFWGVAVRESSLLSWWSLSYIKQVFISQNFIHRHLRNSLCLSSLLILSLFCYNCFIVGLNLHAFVRYTSTVVSEKGYMDGEREAGSKAGDGSEKAPS